MRAIFDVNVLISATLSSRGAPAQLLRAWRDGAFELILSPLLLEEVRRAFSYPKLRQRISDEEANRFVAWLEAEATLLADADPPLSIHSPDPDDDYLIGLAAREHAFLVTGDQHLLSLSHGFPIRLPAAFLRMISGATS